MAFTYEDVTPTLVENTKMQKRLLNGVAKQYLITPNENYVLHETGYDYPDMNDVSIKHKGYTTSTITVPVNYDFETNEREIYAALKNEVENESEGDGDGVD